MAERVNRIQSRAVKSDMAGGAWGPYAAIAITVPYAAFSGLAYVSRMADLAFSCFAQFRLSQSGLARWQATGMTGKREVNEGEISGAPGFELLSVHGVVVELENQVGL